MNDSQDSEVKVLINIYKVELEQNFVLQKMSPCPLNILLGATL